MTDPAVSVAEVWAGILGLGYQRTRVDRGEKGKSAVEVGYGSSTIRVRMFNNREFVKRWDISTRAEADAPDRGKGLLAEILAEIQDLGEQA